MSPGGKILIIDDEQPIRVACAKILAEQGAVAEVLGLAKEERVPMVAVVG